MIVPLPIFLPSTRGYPYPIGPSYNGPSKQDAADHHHKLMEKLDEIGKKDLAVTVQSSSIAAAVNAAFDALSGPAADFELARSRWSGRFSKVQDWKSRRKQKERDRKKQKYKDEMLCEIKSRMAKSWKWIFSTEDQFTEAAERIFKTDYEWRHMELPSFYEMGMEYKFAQFRPSHPKKPKGYDDLPAIRDLLEAIQVAPDSVLTSPVDTIRKVKRNLPDTFAKVESK